MGFRGSSVHTISDNGRVSIPSKIRDVLRRNYSDESMVLVVNRAPDRVCLVAFPAQEWEKVEKGLMNWQNRQEADAARKISAGSEDVTIDKQGRILISQALRTKAGLSGECVIIGLDDRLEIWDKACWDAWDSNTLTERPDDGDERLGSQFNKLYY